MPFTKSTDRIPKLDKLDPIQLITLDKLNPIQLITLDKLNPIQLITLDKLNPIQLITLDKLNPIQLIRILLSQIERFDQMKGELKRAGLKNSYPNQINENVSKELGLNFTTIYYWKRKLGQIKPQHKHSHSEQKELMKRYYEIKDKTPKFRDEEIAKILKIGTRTLVRWKRQFKQQQLHQNSVNGL
uniref:Transposase n=1 Tax=Globodera rostochiensis TaxID=31243 RepID=A0A914HNW5_GLORO